MKLNTCVAAMCIVLLAASVQSAKTGARKETCRLLNKADTFVTLSDTSDTCAADCIKNGKNRASCKCKSFGLPTKVSYTFCRT